MREQQPFYYSCYRRYICNLSLKGRHLQLSSFFSPVDTVYNDHSITKCVYINREFLTSDYIELNGGKPCFNEWDLANIEGEHYSDFDSLGRCGTAYALLDRSMMPTKKREEMEAYSVEDNGRLSYHVFVYNVQPGIELDYATGRNWLKK